VEGTGDVVVGVIVAHSRGELIGLGDSVSFKNVSEPGRSYISSCHVRFHIEICSVLHVTIVV
jgi:hypothetical protein